MLSGDASILIGLPGRPTGEGCCSSGASFATKLETRGSWGGLLGRSGVPGRSSFLLLGRSAEGASELKGLGPGLEVDPPARDRAGE